MEGQRHLVFTLGKCKCGVSDCLQPFPSPPWIQTWILRGGFGEEG